MAALVGVLNESLTESIKAFYKLRKAYIALDNIMQMEEKYLREESARKMASSNISLPPNHSLTVPTKPLVNRSDTSKDPGITSDRASGSQFGNDKPDEPRLSNDVTAFSSTDAEKSSSQPPEPPPSPTRHLDQDPDSDLFTNPVDAFVHSGANLCFGLLLLLISMVPPAFSKLLYIVGFRGDRRRGLRMLWQASKFHNLNGAIAGLALLAYYNGFIRHCDIIDDCPSENEDRVDSYSEHRLTALLSVMRHRFPHSHLWLLEESRMQAAKKNLGAALELLSGDTKSPLKQVEALCVFEKSLTSMYLHKYELCAESFIQCAELNSWSRALYYYIAASAHLAIYRQNALDSPTLAKEHAAKAVELFQKVPSQAGKKKFMARQLPFDVFVTRKITKWESRAKEWNVGFIDAIGVDPLEEMIYLWNGHSRMNEEELQNSLRCLAWSESEQNKHWDRENEDEFAILALLRASIFRFLGRHEESKKLLRSKILVHDPATFKGHLKDDWTCPTAHYEMAANLWMERYSYRPICSTAGGVPANGSQSQSKSTSATEMNHVPKPSMSISSKTSHESNENGEAHDRRKVRECREWIEKVAKWETQGGPVFIYLIPSTVFLYLKCFTLFKRPGALRNEMAGASSSQRAGNDVVPVERQILEKSRPGYDDNEDDDDYGLNYFENLPRNRTSSISTHQSASLSRIQSAISTVSQHYNATLNHVRSRNPDQMRPFTHPLSHQKTSRDTLVDFDGSDDAYHPMNWSFRKKAITTFLYGLTTMGSTWSSAVYSPGITQVDADFHISEEVGVLGVSLLLFGFGLGPLLWAPLSELYGRKPAVLFPYFLAAIFMFTAGSAKDIQTVLISRFFCGFFGSAPVTNTAEERGVAIVGYAMAVVGGPSLGPIVGAAIVQSYLRWRWTEYITGIMMIFFLILDIIFVDESYPAILLVKKARRLRYETGNWSLHAPHEEWDVSFAEMKSVTRASVGHYHSSAAVSVILGAGANLFNQKFYLKKFRTNNRRPVPEARLPPMMVGSVFFSAGLFIFGWTSPPHFPWVAQVIGTVSMGFGFFTVFPSSLEIT
ncbi:conserved hypothetical protein [Histoplasma mississippiense (nom. inval.)]|uniref:conserved hypothetical protein n=1 Tax=Ajellomyces capsulatus (strain NAm1 / WU24) TaxID=2059318 RepID=UPI000157C06F|nr:conserved hypothetical protein [Histoplasma mississippiense (nom. inval.)]EDN06872.1 conserved hypothetical protein [Histoplasma mississippiense (nom. inval.)]